MNLLLTHSVGCTAQFTQWAGIEAVTGRQDAVAAMVDAYRQRRDAVVAGLNAIPGVSCRTPQGAFYAFPNVTSFGKSSAELADLMLERAGVALLPGTAFGPNGEGYLRICFTNSLDNVRRAVERMGNVLADL
jgi:aspartate aminotransferase